MLSDMTKWDPDLQTKTMDEAIRLLRARGWNCRLFVQPHAWDSVLIDLGDVEYHFTPWFFEEPRTNFAIGEWDKGADDYARYTHIKVAFDDGQGLAQVIAEWMAHRTF